MKKVLIITYYWPPSGSAGVQRWLKFVKYLRNFGWEPIVYTPSNAEYPEYDESYLKDIPKDLTVIKTPINEPYSFYKRFIGQKKDVKINTGFLSENNKKKKLTEKISVWIRGNFFIPDAKMFWIKPSVKFLSKYLTENPVDAIVSTGPPHSLQIIALKLSQKFSLPWLADFRDPWTNIDFYKDLMLSSFADRKHHQLELKVLKKADSVVVISESMKEEFLQIYKRDYDVITNGYDTEDVDLKTEIKLDTKFCIAHVGTIAKSRNPVLLWLALSELVKEISGLSEDLEIKIIGKADFSVWEAIEKADLKAFVTKIDYVPHAEATLLQQKSQVLLLSINNTSNAKGILTSKFFEYMAANRPILCIGPCDGDAQKIINETQCGLFAGYDDKEILKENILTFYKKYKNNQLFSSSSAIEKYSRFELTRNLAAILDKITNNTFL